MPWRLLRLKIWLSRGYFFVNTPVAMFKTEQAAPKNIPNIPRPKSIATMASRVLLGKIKIMASKIINARNLIHAPYFRGSISKKGKECKKQASE